MPDQPALTPTQVLIERAFSRRSEINALELMLEDDVAAMIKLGAGKHTGAVPEHEITVVPAFAGSPGAVTFELPEDGEKKAREFSGDLFPKLFRRVVTYVPVEGFEAVAKAILTAAKARLLSALCRKQGKGSSPRKAYILWPKAK